MTADDFVKIVRKGSDKLRVDDIVVNAGQQELHGKGMLRIGPNGIDLDMTLDAGEKPPESRSGIYTKRDYWKMSGMIEDRLRFRCDHVSPVGNQNSFHELTPTGDYDSTYKITFSLHPIELIPSGLDTMSKEDRDRLVNRMQGQGNESEAGGKQVIQPIAKDELPEGVRVHFQASLLEYPLFQLVSGVELKGEIGGYDFALTKQKENEDVRVSLSSKKEYRSPGEQADWRKFHALMEAIAFMHGTHAWPYRVEYWRDGRKMRDRVTSAERLAHTSHAPFNAALAFNARVGEVEWDYLGTIKKVAAFFETDSTLRKEVASLLFLFREADNEVHSEITTLAMCTFFENLVNLFFRELKLKEKAFQENKSLESFERAKTEVSEHIAQKKSENGEGYGRLQQVVSSAALFTQREKLQGVVDHFGLKWEGDMEPIFITWKKARNPLVHDTTRADRTEDQFRESIINESRIAGAINILLLKLFGYTGLMRASAFEEKYRQI